MICRSCGHSDNPIVETEFIKQGAPFIRVEIKNVQYENWQPNQMYACPKCGTVRIKLAGDQP